MLLLRSLCCHCLSKIANHEVQVTYINKLAAWFLHEKKITKESCVRLFLDNEKQLPPHLPHFNCLKKVVEIYIWVIHWSMMFMMNGFSHVSHPSPLSVAVSVPKYPQSPWSCCRKSDGPFFPADSRTKIKGGVAFSSLVVYDLSKHPLSTLSVTPPKKATTRSEISGKLF